MGEIRGTAEFELPPAPRPLLRQGLSALGASAIERTIDYVDSSWAYVVVAGLAFDVVGAAVIGWSALRSGGKEIAAAAVGTGTWAKDVNDRASRLSRVVAEARVGFGLLAVGVALQGVGVIGELGGGWRSSVLGAVLVVVLAPVAAFAVRKETKRLYDVARVRSNEEKAEDRMRSGR